MRHIASPRWSRSRAVRIAAVCGLAAASVLVAAPPANAEAPVTKTIKAGADSYISTREPTDGHGWRTSAYATGGDTFGFVGFDTAGIRPAGYEITDVQLRLKVRENQRPSGHPVVNLAHNNWSEGSLVLENRPSASARVVSQAVTAPAGDWVSIPLSPQYAINPDAASSFELTFDQLYSNFRFDTKESGDAPQLIVTVAPTGGSTQPAPQPPASGGATAPAAAQAAGFTRLAFGDDFDNTDTIDLTGTGQAGKHWYTDRPFGYPKMPAGDLSVSNGVLTIDQSTETGNVGITSVSGKTGNGRGFQYGYMEMRMAFDPANAYKSTGFPSFWSMSRSHLEDASADPSWSELDVFEAYHLAYKSFDNMYVGTVHDLYRGGVPNTNLMNGGNNTYSLPNTDWNQFHTYAALWEPGKVTWYFDGKALLTQRFSKDSAPVPNYAGLPSGTFSMLDKPGNELGLMLGTGPNNPMRVDYVRVWQR